jgi:hypothetical protein
MTKPKEMFIGVEMSPTPPPDYMEVTILNKKVIGKNSKFAVFLWQYQAFNKNFPNRKPIRRIAITKHRKKNGEWWWVNRVDLQADTTTRCMLRILANWVKPKCTKDRDYGVVANRIQREDRGES